MNTERESLEILKNDILPYVLEKSSFYKKHLTCFRADTAFSSLPFTDAEMLALHGGKMLCKSLHSIERIRTFYTSGSSSSPKRVYFDEGDMERTVSFFAKHMEYIAPPKKSVLILMSDTKPGSIADLLQRALAKIHRRSIIFGRPSSAESLLALLDKASCIVALPADALYLCRKFPFFRPTSVLLSADYIPRCITQSIEKIWKTAVFEHYGLTESCYGLAVQCKHRKNMHIRNEDFYVEVINPETLQAVEYGVPGEIVISSLKKSAHPFIRYRTGDIGVLSKEKCTCGNATPSLERVCGRIENLGKKINIHALDDMIFSLPQVLSYQASIKKGRLFLTVEGDEIDTSELESALAIPLEVDYRNSPPWQYRGKRVLS